MYKIEVGSANEERKLSTDIVLGFDISTVLHQQLQHVDMAIAARPVQGCIAILWDDASATRTGTASSASSCTG